MLLNGNGACACNECCLVCRIFEQRSGEHEGVSMEINLGLKSCCAFTP